MNKALVNCVMLPVSHGHVLIPNTAVASMISYSQPAPLPTGPAWLLGMLNWQGWYLPVVSWSGILSPDVSEPVDNARIAIIKNLQPQTGMPYFAIISQGFPRLVSITADDLKQIDNDPFADEQDSSNECILARVHWEDRLVDLLALPELAGYISRHLQSHQ
ncbi:MAG: chemotaxis protein CheW [Gammaproteobacteria bacterium]|jgi:chemosensory pili system protein ChpC|nr:chemotaxis protein CheW [Gammaproteobacteria bacterium]